MTRNVALVWKHPRPGKTCNTPDRTGAALKVNLAQISIAEAAARLSAARRDSTYDIISSLNGIADCGKKFPRVRNRVGDCMKEDLLKI